MTLAYRTASAPDMAFIVDAWVDSYKYSHTAGPIPADMYRATYWPIVERAINLPNTRTIVAYETDDTDHIADLYGFIAVDTSDVPLLCWYVYVKESYRRMGLARGLFTAAGINPDMPFHFGWKTAVVAELIQLRKLPCARFDPNPMRFDNPRRRDEQPAAADQDPRERRYRREASSPIVERRRSR